MKIEKILIVDDDDLIRDFLVETLQRLGYKAFDAPNGAKALEIVKDHTIDLVFTDMKMPKMSGLDLLKKVKEVSPKTIVIVITAYGSIDNAVEAIRLGAFNYILKPFTADTVEALVSKAGEHFALIEENDFLKETVISSFPEQTIGESPEMKQIFSIVKRISESNASVFIHGESGTGKEVIAHAIHNHSHRSGKPFIKVNCAAIPETLIESEFFGHEKGAFTGASARRLGRFELANTGSLLLDEISEIPHSLQAKLLRVTQEKEFERVGGTHPIKVDVRLISTSNRDIRELIEKKFMREDLFYRLNVVPIYIPPLRERKEDIIPLSEHFVKQLCKENNRKAKQLTNDAKKLLLDYSWPGNVRELQNVIERAIVTMNPESVKIEVKDIYITADKTPNPSHDEKQLLRGMTLKELEKQLIIETFHSSDRNPAKAAKTLGIPENLLYDKLKEYELE